MGTVKLEWLKDNDTLSVVIEYYFDDTILMVKAKWANGQKTELPIIHADPLKRSIAMDAGKQSVKSQQDKP